MATTHKFNSIPSKTLASSITAASTTFRLNDIKGWDGTSLTAADFGTITWAVFSNAAKDTIEIMEIDPTTIASTDITINKRGMKFLGDLTTQVTANKLDWTKSDTFIQLGTDSPQTFQWLKEYIDSVAIAGSPTATTTTQGLVEISTQAEFDAGTAIGGTGASLTATPAIIRAKKYNDYVADTGAANAYVIAPSPAITAYTTGQVFVFKATLANTGASTVNVNGLGVKSIVKSVTTALVTGDILASQMCEIIYDGINFILISPITPTAPTVQVFTSTGTYTKPSGLKYAIIEGVGGGGGGDSSGSNGPGGGAGGYFKKLVLAASIGTTETATIGGAGVGGTVPTSGGNTTFGTLLTGNGGGITNNGGTATGGDINITGGPGAQGSSGTGANYSIGGSSQLGRGAISSGAATGYGAGGAGATGSNGTSGIIIITEYYL
jgi:hypothetical protein